MVNGVVQIVDYTFIGANATVRNGARICADNLIGAGAVITKDTAEGEVYVSERSVLLKKKSDKISIE